MISLHVDGDAPSCRAAALRLRGLHRAADTCADHLRDEAGCSSAEFAGLAGDAFRHATGDLHLDAVALAADASTGAAALDDFADGLEEVADLMARARRAAGHLLDVVGDQVVPPAPDETGPMGVWRARAWRSTRALWRRGRDREAEVQDALRAALRGAGSPDSPYARLPLPGPAAPPGQPPAPPSPAHPPAVPRTPPTPPPPTTPPRTPPPPPARPADAPPPEPARPGVEDSTPSVPSSPPGVPPDEGRPAFGHDAPGVVRFGHDGPTDRPAPVRGTYCVPPAGGASAHPPEVFHGPH